MNKQFFKYIIQILLVIFVFNINLFAENQPLLLNANKPDATLFGGFMNPTVVSFATEGMWAQSKILDSVNITGTLGTKGLGHWVPLIYLVSIASAIIMLALGQSPKMAMWFVLGPCIYYFMIDSQVDAKGSAWIAGTQYVTNMKPVWRLAEVGMTNSAMVNIAGQTYDRDTGPSGTTKISWLFTEYDELLTATVQELIDWTGIYNQKDTKHLQATPDAANKGADWYLMTNYKWKILNDITSVTVKDQNVRDALVYFMSSKCGDMISNRIDSGSYITATNTKGGDIPDTLFRGTYDEIVRGADSLATQTIPMPIPVRSLTKDRPSTAAASSKVNSFFNFMSKSQGGSPLQQPQMSAEYNQNKDISCTSYLWVIMQAFRYEATNAFLHLTQINQEYGINQDNAVYSLLYGWTFKDGTQKLVPKDQKEFVVNLILAHMFRNEMTMARKPVDVAYSSSEDLGKSSENYIRNLGGKSKWSDLFTAFKIFPHIQGLIAYFVIMVFPLAVMLMVLPAGWKSLITWMGFYAYIKSWDFGFALAASIERSVWARIGNSERTAVLNSNIMSLFRDPVGGMNAGDLRITMPDNIKIDLPANISLEPAAGYFYDQALYHFDRLLALSNVLDYDLNNSYYMYIMFAVYMAIPTVSAQLFLKGKSSLVSGLMDGAKALGQDGSKAALQGAQGKMLTDADNAFQVAGQAAYVKDVSGKDSLAMQAIGGQNKAMQMTASKQDLGLRTKIEADTGKMNQMNMKSKEMQIGAFSNILAGNNQLMAGRMRGTWGPVFEGDSSGVQQMVNNATGTFSRATGRKGTSGSGAGGGGKGGGEEPGFLATSREIGVSTAGRMASGAAAGGTFVGLMEYNLRGHGGQVLTQLASMHYQMQGMGIEADAMLKQSDLNVRGFQLGMHEESTKAMASRNMSAAEQQANSAKWDSQRDLGSQYTSHFSALGATPGRYSAGPKPTNLMGMAGTGELGEYGSTQFSAIDLDHNSAANQNGQRTALYTQMYGDGGNDGQNDRGYFQDYNPQMKAGETRESFFADQNNAHLRGGSLTDAQSGIGHFNGVIDLDQAKTDAIGVGTVMANDSHNSYAAPHLRTGIASIENHNDPTKQLAISAEQLGGDSGQIIATTVSAMTPGLDVGQLPQSHITQGPFGPTESQSARITTVENDPSLSSHEKEVQLRAIRGEIPLNAFHAENATNSAGNPILGPVPYNAENANKDDSPANYTMIQEQRDQAHADSLKSKQAETERTVKKTIGIPED